jgi:dimethylargininase
MALSVFGRHARAIIRKIDPKLAEEALRSVEKSASLNMTLANEQHSSLVSAIEGLGCTIHEIESNDFPDSVFVEDTAIYAQRQVLLTRPGAESRRGEIDGVFTKIEELALDDWNNMKLGDELFVGRMDALMDEEEDVTLEGGDVLFTGFEFIVGESARTNAEGIQMLRECFPNIPVTTVDIRDTGLLHLKSCCSMAGPDHFLFGGEVGKYVAAVIKKESLFIHDQATFVPDEEAANAIFLNGSLIRRADEEFPRSADVFAKELSHIPQIPMIASELAKVDGALTCCTILM